jgi:polyisoprenoid-binding protein YceI
MRKARRQSFALACALLLAPAAPGLARHSPTKTHGADAGAATRGATTQARYRIDAARSKFTVRAFSGGPLWFKGHDHIIAVRDFAGEVVFDPASSAGASLVLRVNADSLAETRDVFTEQQKQIINRELREIVIQPDKYPEITFKSTAVTVALEKGVFKARIDGDLTLHGVTRRVRIPADVSISAGDLRARGEFTIDRGDFNVKATSAFHGMVRVRDKLKLTFDIVARQA